MNIFSRYKKIFNFILPLLISFFLFNSCSIDTSSNNESLLDITSTTNNYSISNIPDYTTEDLLILNNNIPIFDNKDMITTSFEEYTSLDDLGRCGIAFANIGIDIMPTDDRDSISSVTPSGWQSVKYDIISGKYLYNRSHLIGFQLTAENANEYNLITGTRYLNVDLMLPYENMVADYIKKTRNHVLYRVTPLFEEKNLIAKGVQIEAFSVEDNGEGIEFNIFLYNIQPGISINYLTGDSALISDNLNLNKNDSIDTSNFIIRGNSNSKIYHCPGQRDYENMLDSKNLILFESEEDAISEGYRKASR